MKPNEEQTKNYLNSFTELKKSVEQAEKETIDEIKKLKSKEKELEAFRSILMDLSLPVCRFDQNGNILYANPSFCIFFDKTEQDILGINITDMIDGDDFLTGLTDLNINKRNSVSNIRYQPKDGITKWLKWTIQVLLDEKGELHDYQAYFEDVTENKKHIDSLEVKANLIEKSKNPIFTINSDGIIKTWNTAAEKLYGYKSEEILDKDLSLITSPDYHDKIDQCLKKINSEDLGSGIKLERLSKNMENISVISTFSQINSENNNSKLHMVVDSIYTEEKNFDAKEIFNKLPIGFISSNKLGQVVDVNDYMIKNFKADNWIGREINETFPDNNAKQILPPLMLDDFHDKVFHDDINISFKENECIFHTIKFPYKQDEETELVATIIYENKKDKKMLNEMENLKSEADTFHSIHNLIHKEADFNKLLKGICTTMSDHRKYHSTWVALIDENGKVLGSASGGDDGWFKVLREQLKNRNYTSCIRKALTSSEAIVIKNPENECPDCKSNNLYQGKGVMITRLEYSDNMYGLMGITASKEVLTEHEIEIFKDLSQNIAYTFHYLRLEKHWKFVENTMRRYELIISTVRDPMYFLDKNYVFQSVNIAFLKAFRMQRKDLIGNSFDKIMGNDVFQAQFKTFIDRCLAGEEVTHTDWYQLPYGSRYLEISYFPFAEKNGTISGVIVNSRDLTHQKKIEDSLEVEKKFGHLFENMINGFAFHEIIFDDKNTPVNYRILKLNSIYSELTGLPEDSIGKTILEIKPNLDKTWIQTYANVATNGEAIRFEEYQKDKKKWLEVIAYSPKKDQFVTLVSEITEQKNKMNELVELEQKSRNVIENSPAGYFRINKEGIYEDVNKTWLHLHKYSVADEIINKHFTLMISENDPSLDNLPDLILSGESVLKDNFPILCKDGVVKKVLLKTTPIIKDNEIIGIEGLIIDNHSINDEDIDFIKRDSRFKSYFEIGTIAMAITDTQNKFVEVNHFFEKLFGYDGELLKTKNISELMYPEDKNNDSKYKQRILNGDIEEYSVLKRFLRHDDTIMDTIFSVRCLSRVDGTGSYYLNIIVDVTKQNAKRHELEQIINQIKENTSDLTQYIYLTSLDLKTPLVNIQGFSKDLELSINDLGKVLDNKQLPMMIKKKTKRILGEEIPESIKFINSSSSSLDTLISNLIKTTKLGLSPLKIEQLDMNELLQNVFADFEYFVQENQVEIKLDELPGCHGDFEQLTHAFSHLIQNSLSYLSGEKPSINIYGKEVKDQIIYCIEDNGNGISKEDQKTLIDILQLKKTDISSRSNLGFSIVSKIIKQHKGKIWLNSEIGNGSRFFISLPK